MSLVIRVFPVYENGVASRVLLINYVTEPGTGDYTANIAIGGQQTGLPSITPTSVRVKYLLTGSQSVSEKYNITWYVTSHTTICNLCPSRNVLLTYPSPLTSSLGPAKPWAARTKPTVA